MIYKLKNITFEIVKMREVICFHVIDRVNLIEDKILKNREFYRCKNNFEIEVSNSGSSYLMPQRICSMGGKGEEHNRLIICLKSNKWDMDTGCYCFDTDKERNKQYSIIVNGIKEWDKRIEKIKKTGIKTITINVAKDFNKAPTGRYRNYGEFSAQRFREEFLVPAFKSNIFTKINIVLDGLDGIGASFWDEAFGGLIKKEGISLEEINRKLVLICDDDVCMIPLIRRFLEKKLLTKKEQC